MLCAAPPRVGVGGRWRVLEEENDELSLELQTLRNEVASTRQELQVAKCGFAASASDADALRGECHETTVEVCRLRGELASVSASLWETSEARVVANGRVDQLEVARTELTEECSSIQRSFEVLREETVQQRRILASSELRAANEGAGRCRAEADIERLRAEVEAAAFRLVNRGTHVDLLLREKERLWGQLSRERKRCEPRAKVAENTTAAGGTQTHAKKARAPPGSGVEGGVRPASAGAQPRQGKGAGKMLKASHQLATSNPAASSVAELERRLWHTQRALDKERQSHEETRESLKACQGACHEGADVAV